MDPNLQPKYRMKLLITCLFFLQSNVKFKELKYSAVHLKKFNTSILLRYSVLLNSFVLNTDDFFKIFLTPLQG